MSSLDNSTSVLQSHWMLLFVAVNQMRWGIGDLIDLGIEETDVSTYYTAQGWVCELFDMNGILRASGPMDTGKTRLTKDVLMPLQYQPYPLVGSLTEANLRREMMQQHKAGLKTLVCDDVGWDAAPQSVRSDLLINRCVRGGKASYLESDGGGGWFNVTQEIHGPTLLGCRLTFSDVAIESRCLDISMATQHRTSRSLRPSWDGSDESILKDLQDFRNKALNYLKPAKHQTPRGGRRQSLGYRLAHGFPGGTGSPGCW